jgi:hypothetical protein
MVGAKQQSKLKSAVVAVFEQGIEVALRLPDEIYAGNDPLTSIGAHFRHNLEFAIEFLNGIEAGIIDYSARARDMRVASDRAYGALRMRETIDRIAAFETGPATPVTVVSEVDSSTRLLSSAGRELEFLLSHTIHHFAIIAHKLESLGIAIPTDFGVAPSTLEFWKNRNQGEQ